MGAWEASVTGQPIKSLRRQQHLKLHKKLFSRARLSMHGKNDRCKAALDIIALRREHTAVQDFCIVFWRWVDVKRLEGHVLKILLHMRRCYLVHQIHKRDVVPMLKEVPAEAAA